MKKVTVKIPAKINFTLDVLGKKGGYHDIESLVSNINIYDVITVKKRNDKRVTLLEKGIKAGCPVEANNAYKSAILFMQTFKTPGVDIVLDKKIPVGAGLGGSSADISGVLLAMKKLYGVKKELGAIADALGSDSKYMMMGGLAIISGKGSNIISLSEKVKIRALVVLADFSVLSKECYEAFDKLNKTFPPKTNEAVHFIHDGDLKGFVSVLKNDLYFACAAMHPELEENLSALRGVGAVGCVMTGSGSAVYGVFKDKKSVDAAYRALYPKYKNKLIKAKTI